jgi:hypothetical protein
MDKKLLICTNLHENLWIIEGKLADKNFGYKNESAYNQNLEWRGPLVLDH